MGLPESDRRRAIAQRVADAHRPLAAAHGLMAFVSGSVVDELAGLNGRYFARFQFKRMPKFAAGLDWAPAGFVKQVEALLAAAPREAFVRLYALEGELLDRVEAGLPDVDTTAIRRRRADFLPD